MRGWSQNKKKPGTEKVLVGTRLLIQQPIRAPGIIVKHCACSFIHSFISTPPVLTLGGSSYSLSSGSGAR